MRTRRPYAFTGIVKRGRVRPQTDLPPSPRSRNCSPRRDPAGRRRSRRLTVEGWRWLAFIQQVALSYPAVAGRADLSGEPVQKRSFLGQGSLPHHNRLADVQNSCPKSTSHNQPCHRVLRRFHHGTSARLRPRLHHRPAPPAPGRRPRSVPAAIGCSARRPAVPAPTGPPSSSSWTSCGLATPWSCGSWIGSAGRCGIWSTRSLGWLIAGSGSAASRRRSTPPPPAASWCSTSSPLWPSSNATLIRERTAAGLAAARAAGRQAADHRC